MAFFPLSRHSSQQFKYKYKLIENFLRFYSDANFFSAEYKLWAGKKSLDKFIN